MYKILFLLTIVSFSTQATVITDISQLSEVKEIPKGWDTDFFNPDEVKLTKLDSPQKIKINLIVNKDDGQYIPQNFAINFFKNGQRVKLKTGIEISTNACKSFDDSFRVTQLVENNFFRIERSRIKFIFCF